MKLSDKWAKCVAAVVALSIGAAAPALAGSVTRPGDTAGLAVGVPLPEGLWLGNNATQECRDTSPKDTCYFVDTPILVWSTPWTIFGARIQPTFGPLVPIKFNSGVDASGLFNSFAAVQLIWDLGDDWGVSYMLGGYTNNLGSSVAVSSASLNQRFGISYIGDGWNLSANIIWGINFDDVTDKPQISPCPVSVAYPRNGCNPDFVNVDLTATKRFDEWELGSVGWYSSDLSSPIAAYQRQSQFSLGVLVGYNFDPVSVQAYVTRNVYEDNYGGYNISGNLRITIPLWRPDASAPPPPNPPQTSDLAPSG